MTNFWTIKQPLPTRTALHILALNLCLFIVVTSLPQFRHIHHHFIFPVLGLLYAFQWCVYSLMGRWRRVSAFYDSPTAQSTLLFIMGFMSILGVIRHLTILMCFDRCSLKLAAAMFLSGAVFFLQSFKSHTPFWSPVRAQIVAMGSFVWGIYLVFYAVNINPWVLESGMVIFGLIFWLMRRNRARLALALAIFFVLVIKHLGGEQFIIILSLSLILGLLSVVGNLKDPLFSFEQTALSAGLSHFIARISRLFTLRFPKWMKIIFWTLFVCGSLYFLITMVRYPSRQTEQRALLLQHAGPTQRTTDQRLSPLASALRHHVVSLTCDIDERSTVYRKGVFKAQAAIEKYLKTLGYQPRLQLYPIDNGTTVSRRFQFANIEVVLGQPHGDGIWVVGAHYDAAIDTPGADDNASGVAILMELARLLKGKPINKELHLVAFCSEEPPSFGTRHMGSFHYAQGLKDMGRPVKGVLVLEMLGYFNNREKTQLYPPFLDMFFPSQGNFVAIGSNWASRALLRHLKLAWKQRGKVPLETVILPSVFSNFMMSDQLNFWDAGYPAVIMTDTAFYRNPNYHQSTDTADTLDYESMARITETLAAILQTNEAAVSRF